MKEKEHVSSAANPGDGFSGNGQWFQVEHGSGMKKKKKQPKQEQERIRLQSDIISPLVLCLLNRETKKNVLTVLLQIVASATI